MAAGKIIELPPLAEAMLRPDFYPHHPDSVEMVQTHISMVFLAGPLVYKIKKPVDFGFLDFSTLSKRSRACEDEVRLNARLTRGVYLGTVNIYQRGNEFSLSPPGRVVEKAVLMKRLPDRRLLSNLLEHNRATVAQVRSVARRIADFHRHADAALPRFCRISALEKNLTENFQQTLPYLGLTVNEKDYLLVWNYTEDFLKQRRPLLEKRIKDGRLKDCHGDLHAEHICLDKGVQIFDCIEFSPRIRQGDTAGDIAFLYMDLLYHGHPILARELMEEYLKQSRDWEVRLLLPFYACYRAVVREKVESFRLADASISRKEKAVAARRASGYFRLASSIAGKDAQPRLVMVGGLPGTGKSVIAREFAERIGAEHINSDVVRKELAGISFDMAVPAPIDRGIYTPKMTELTYDEMMLQAANSLNAGKSVVLDATFSLNRWRRMALALARRTGAVPVVVECTCPVNVVRKRMDERLKKRGVSDAGWDVYLAMRRNYEAPAGAVRLNTTRPMEESLASIAAAAYPF